MKFKFINPVSAAYLILTVLIANFLIVLALLGASSAKFVEGLRYWFAPWTVDFSHAFGFASGDVLRLLFATAGITALAGFVVRGFSRRPGLALAATIAGIAGVIDWFVLTVLSYVAMHLY